MSRWTEEEEEERRVRVDGVEGSHGGVEQAAGDGAVLGVEAVGLGEPLDADPLDLVVGVEAEEDGVQLPRRRLQLLVGKGRES